MTLDDIDKTLTEYAKYRQGRGRKYAEPDVPFGNETVTEAIKDAVSVIRATIKFFNKVK